MGLSQTIRFILGHPMNRGRPVAALARFAVWQVRSRLQDEVIVDWIDGARLAVRRGMTGATGNIYCGLHEYVDMRFLLDTLKPGDLFVDIGANVGSYTVLASKVCGARTIAVEPDPGAAAALRRNVEINGIGTRVEVVEAALGAAKGTVAFTVGRDTVNRIAETGDTCVREVALITLDEALAGKVPRLIKIDVEGFEAEVFKGAQITLADPGLEAIVTESQDRAVIDVLERFGFERAYYDPDNRVIQDRMAEASHNCLMVRKPIQG